MKNKRVKQMICDVGAFIKSGCLPETFYFGFHENQFGYWVWIRSGWFFRAVYYGRVSVAAERLRIKHEYYCQCDNPACGNWFDVSEVGVACKECGHGEMHPQDVEPH
ncbi:MAG: hypothetical protein ACRCSE_01785 [Vibrio sp.]